MMTPQFDRSDLDLLLRKRVDGFQAGYRQNLALIGAPGMGKSTLIRRFLLEQTKPGSLLLPLYLEVGSEESASEWAARFIRTVLYAVLQLRKGESFPAHLSELVETCSALVPRTAALSKKITHLCESGRLDEAYDHLWELPHLLTLETGHRVLLVLDEFHRLRALSVKEPFRSLGKKIMVQSTTMYLVASSEPQAAYSILREGLALLFGKFEVIEVPPLTSAACRKAIRQLQPEEMYDPFTEYLLIDLAQGNPHRLQQLLGSWQQHPYLPELLETLFVDPESTLRRDFEKRLRQLPSGRNRMLALEVLESVAAGVHRLPHLAVQLRRPVAQIAGVLRLLEGCRLIQKEGSFYRVTERLFQAWLVTAHPVLQGVALISADQASTYFRKAAGSWMQQMRKAASRPVEEQLQDLLLLWDDEVVELEGRKVLLPRFRSVERVPGPLDQASLLGRTAKRQKGGWWIIPWSGDLDEAAAHRMVEQIRAFAPLKDYRKLLIGASRADVNARLVLQEAKVRFWDLPSLNQLLDLYGLARIPLPEGADLPAAQTVPLQEPAAREIVREPGLSGQGTG